MSTAHTGPAMTPASEPIPGMVRQIPVRSQRAMLLAELAEFATRRRPCGGLTGDATEPEANGYLLTVG